MRIDCSTGRAAPLQQEPMSICGCLSAFSARGKRSTNHIRYLVGEVPENNQKNQGASPIGKKARFCCYCRVPTPTFEAQATAFSAANALLLAQASQAAYLNEADAQARMAQLGLPNFRWIDLTEDFAGLHAFAA